MARIGFHRAFVLECAVPSAFPSQPGRVVEAVARAVAAATPRGRLQALATDLPFWRWLDRAHPDHSALVQEMAASSLSAVVPGFGHRYTRDDERGPGWKWKYRRVCLCACACARVLVRACLCAAVPPATYLSSSKRIVHVLLPRLGVFRQEVGRVCTVFHFSKELYVELTHVEMAKLGSWPDPLTSSDPGGAVRPQSPGLNFQTEIKCGKFVDENRLTKCSTDASQLCARAACCEWAWLCLVTTAPPRTTTWRLWSDVSPHVHPCH